MICPHCNHKIKDHRVNGARAFIRGNTARENGARLGALVTGELQLADAERGFVVDLRGVPPSMTTTLTWQGFVEYIRAAGYLDEVRKLVSFYTDYEFQSDAVHRHLHEEPAEPEPVEPAPAGVGGVA